MLKYALLALTSLTLIGCTQVQPTSEDIQNAKQEQTNKQAVETVGMPAITNFQEKRILKDIYELRDTQIRTWSYTQDMNGHLHKLCDSIGYGIPAATQYTNPQAKPSGYYAEPPIPQADPNGLYSPASAEGTWILCKAPNQDKTVPVYVEPRLIVSPFALNG